MNTLRFISGFVASFLALVLQVPVLILGIPFWLMGILQRLICQILRYSQAVIIKVTQWIHPLPKTWHILESLMQYEPVIGWKPRPNLSTYSKDKAGGKYKLTTDAAGWRQVQNPSDRNDVFVFGDSFAFGYGANDEDFFANLISYPRIKTFGTNGYSLVQELLLMEQYSSMLSYKTVIWFIYHGNDLYENLTPNRSHYRMPFMREINGTSDWEIVSKHVTPEPWTIITDRNYRGKLAEICSNTTLSRRAFEACNFLIETGKNICARENAKLIVFSLPDISQIDNRRISKLASLSPDKHTFDENKPDRELKAICVNHSVPFYSMKYFLNPDDYLEKDSHWNKKGNRKIAELIRDVYFKYNSPDSSQDLIEKPNLAG